MEVKSKRADVFHLYDQKAVKSNIAESGRSNIIFINTFLCWICFVFLAKPGSVNEGISGIQIFLLYFIAMFGTIWLWSICSVILCTLLRNMWAGIGCLFGIVIGLISKAGSSFFGNLGLFSFSFCEPTQLMSESWIYGTLVSFIAGLFLFAVLPMTLKKRG
ncbi:MAG: transporter [Blautia wexlerae]